MEVAKIKKLMKMLKLNKMLYDQPKYKVIEKGKSSDSEYIVTKLIANIEDDILILAGDEDNCVIGRLLESIDYNETTISKKECCIGMKNGEYILIQLIR